VAAPPAEMVSDDDTRFVMGVGAMRAGSGWTYSYLRTREEVYCSGLKEWHFFDARHRPRSQEWINDGRLDLLERRLRNAKKALEEEDAERFKQKLSVVRDVAERLMIGSNLEAYRSFFLKNRGRRNIVAEFTPQYSVLDRNAFAEMNGLTNDVRFVFVVRNPADRFWSHFQFYQKKGKAQELEAALENNDYVLKSDYGRTLTELYSVVPKERVHIEFFERLFTPGAIERLCAFIDIPYKPAVFDQRGKNTAAKTSTPKITPDVRTIVSKRFEHAYRYFEQQEGVDLPDSWKKDLQELDAGKAQPSPVHATQSAEASNALS
jgi:hypothetical protein